MTNKHSEQSKKKEITVATIIFNGLKSTEEGSPSYHKFAFIEYENIQVGDVIDLAYDDRRKGYNQFPLLFDYQYFSSNFLKKQIYLMRIVKEIKNFYIIVSDNLKYAKIYKDSMVKKTDGYKTGDLISVATVKRNQLSMFDANMVLFLDEIEYKSGVYPFRISKIEKNDNIDRNIHAYNFYTNNGLKIFLPQNYDKLYQLNYSFFNTEIFVNGYIELWLKYNNINNWFELNLADSLTHLVDEQQLGKLEFDDSSSIFYFETKCGFISLYDRKLTYLDKILLKLLVGHYLEFTVSPIMFYPTIVYSICLKEVNLDNNINEFKNCTIVDFCDNNLDKRIFLIEYSEGLYGFLESSDYSYDNQVPTIGETIEKLKFKSTVNNTFLFFTRKPYILDPKIVFFKDKDIGSQILGKVKRIDDSFITITINNQFDFYVFKENLLPLKFFKIDEFYTQGDFYPFYILRNKPNILLMGYNYNELFDKKLQLFKNNTLVTGSIYKQMLTKYIIRLADNIEAELPLDEISYLGKDELEGKSEQKLQFKIININIDKQKMTYKISLSRMRLSHSIYHFKKKYPVGSIVSGDFFYADHDGYYFNLKHKGCGIPELTGFLSNYEISNYPDIAVFSQHVINNEDIKFQITSYPNDNLVKNGSVFEKSITLSIRKFNDYDIDKFFATLSRTELFFKDDDILTSQRTFLNDNNRIYFYKNFGEKAVFSLHKNHFIPGLATDNNNFTDFYVNYISNLIEYSKNTDKERKEVELLKIIFNSSGPISNFVLKDVQISFLNEVNNSIEIEYHNFVLDNIKKHLKITDLTIVGQSSDEEHYWGWFLNNELFKIKVILIGGEIEMHQTYKISIEDFNENCNSLIAQISYLTQDSVGKYFKTKIIGKINAKQYSVQFLTDKIGVLNCSNAQFTINELLSTRLISTHDNEYQFEYTFNGLLDFENIERISISDLSHELFKPEKLACLKQQDLFNYLISLKNKLITTQEHAYLQEINTLISLIDNGTMKDQFIIDNKIYGQGQFGKVYRGINLTDKKDVVCKKYISNRSEDIELDRFNLEADILNRLDIDGVVKLLKYYENDNEYISEFAKGITLRELIKINIDKSYSWKKKNYLDLLIKLATTFDEIHQMNIVHCDIKPENIICNLKDDRVFIIDFGSAQSQDMKGGFGTIFYSSPKQCHIFSNEYLHFTEEHCFTVKDDLYSFGVMMYEMFCGKLPYSDNLEEETIIFAHQYGQLDQDTEYSFVNPILMNSEIEPSIEGVILKLMALSEDERYNDFFDLIEALEEIL